jgi:hypothetical protein
MDEQRTAMQAVAEEAVVAESAVEPRRAEDVRVVNPAPVAETSPHNVWVPFTEESPEMSEAVPAAAESSWEQKKAALVPDLEEGRADEASGPEAEVLSAELPEAQAVIGSDSESARIAEPESEPGSESAAILVSDQTPAQSGDQASAASAADASESALSADSTRPEAESEPDAEAATADTDSRPDSLPDPPVSASDEEPASEAAVPHPEPEADIRAESETEVALSEPVHTEESQADEDAEPASQSAAEPEAVTQIEAAQDPEPARLPIPEQVTPDDSEAGPVPDSDPESHNGSPRGLHPDVRNTSEQPATAR